MKKAPGRPRALPVILAVLLILFLFTASMLLRLLLGYREGAQEYAALAGQAYRKEYLPVTAGPRDASGGKDGGENAKEEGLDRYVEAVAKDSIQELSKVNADIAAWIEIPGIGLSYPVMHGTDNSYYLKHTFLNHENEAGALFIESSQKGDFKEPNTVVYGHHRKDGSMFGRLTDYKKKDCFEKNSRIYVTTQEGVYRYDIFSCYTTRYDSVAYTLFSGFGPEYDAYRDMAAKASLHPAKGPAGALTPILTLSTCESREKEERFVVHAALVGELSEK